MKFLIANLKSNHTLKDTVRYEKELNAILAKSDNLIVCPSSLYLPFFQGTKYTLGAQNVSMYGMGSHTGEINAEQLATLGVKYVLIGHSERRKEHNENETTIANKIRNALDNKIIAVYCIGETKEQYDRKKTFVVLEKQIGRILNEFTHEELKNVIIAYEPVWAIGTGITPSKEEISQIINFIKKLMFEYYELKTAVIYGGSVDENNIKEINQIKALDGFLIGGASLDINKLNNIINSVN